jgi:lactoylglutathione lyase
MPIQCMAYVAIRVADLERARRFYRDGLGFAELSRLEVSGGSPTARLLGLDELEVSALFLERDGTRLELQQLALPAGRALPAPRAQLGLSHLALRVQDLDAVVASLVVAGGRVLEESRFARADLRSRVVVLEDPDGTRVELIEMPGDPRAPLGRPLR